MYTVRTTLVLDRGSSAPAIEVPVPPGVDPNKWAAEVIKLRTASISNDDFHDAVVSLLLTYKPS